jgi:hypothetical protein
MRALRPFHLRRDLLAAFPLNLCARTVNAFTTSPRASILTGALPAGTSPLAQQFGRDHGSGIELRFERVQIDDLVGDAERVCEAALGTRRCSGIWPPSNRA